MLQLTLFTLAHAGEGAGHTHGPEFSGTQIIGLLVIVVIAAGVMFLLGKRKK